MKHLSETKERSKLQEMEEKWDNEKKWKVMWQN